MSRKAPFRISLVLLALGLGVSEYLLLRALLLAAELPQTEDWCSALFGRGCDRALSDPSSEVAGIPLAGWGVTYFGSVLLLLVLGWALDGFRHIARAVALALGAGAALGSAILAVGILDGSLPYCPLCLAVHGINGALLPLLWLVARGGDSRSSARVRAWPHIAGGSLLSLAASVVLYVWISATWRDATYIDPARVVASHLGTPRAEIPLEDDVPRLGPPNATVRMVVFSDFQCPACREFARGLPDLLGRFPGRLAVYFRHYPLSSRCHPRLARDLHPGSCELAWATEAARRQDGFWRLHDLLFSFPGRLDPGVVRRAAAEAGLDAPRFEADWRDPGARARVDRDLALGTSLGVDGTPSVFLNGRRVRDLRLPVLSLLISAEAREAGAPVSR